jgi:hypothetical protein
MPTTVPSSMTMMTPRQTASSTSHGLLLAPDPPESGDNGASTVLA